MDVFQYVAKRNRKPSPSAPLPSVVQQTIQSLIHPHPPTNWDLATKHLDIEGLITSLSTRLSKGQSKGGESGERGGRGRPKEVNIDEIEKKVEQYARMQKAIRDLAEKRRMEDIRKLPILHPSLSLPRLTSVNFGDSRIDFIFHSVKNDIPQSLPRPRKLRRQSMKNSHRVTTEIVEDDEDETSTRFFQVRESPSPYSVAESMSEFDDAVKMLLQKSFTEPHPFYSSKKPQSPIPEEDSHFVSSDEEMEEDIDCFASRRRLDRNRHFPLSKAEDPWPPATIEPLGLRLYRPLCPPNSKEVPAEDTAPQYGPMMKYGFLRKKRGEHRKFHKRFVVLRGFRLYWYRKSNATWAKGVITVPLDPILQLKVNRETCFGLSKGNKKYFVIAEDTASVNWDVTLSNLIAYRRLIEDEGMYHDFHGVVSYFQNMHCAELRIAERSLPATVLSYMSQALPAHTKLQIISLTHCQLSDESLQPFLSALLGTVRLEALDLSQNMLTKVTAGRIGELIKQEESQWNRLIHLTLSGNPIRDEGLDILSRAFRVRFEEMYWPKALYQLPFFTLELSDCSIGDAGMVALCDALEQTFECIATEADIEPRMKLDLSRNQCTSQGFGRLRDLMAMYQPVSGLNLAEVGKVTPEDVSSLLEVMVQNYSILTLDVSGLPLSLSGLTALVELLNFNYILTSIRFTLDGNAQTVLGAKYKEVKSLFTIRVE